MTKKRSILSQVIILFLAASVISYSQVDYEFMSGAGKENLDTLAFQRGVEISKEAAGLLEREIDPEKYIVGPNDIFKIDIITGSKTPDFTAKVSPEGMILLDNIGIINVKDKTLSEVKKLIKDKVRKVYNTDEIYVALSELKEFKVTVSGSIRKPASVAATGVDRVSEIIEKAGGTKHDASLRNIILKRIGIKEPIYVDIIKFFLIGDEESNPTVRGGDLIIIPPLNESTYIEITGEVRSESAYEYVEGDSLSTLVKFAQGFLPSAMLDSVVLTRMSGKSNSLDIYYFDLSSWKDNIFNKNELKGDIRLHPGDRVIVKRSKDWQDATYVKIFGEVNYPGKYPIVNKGETIREIIIRAGGFTDEASIESVEFIRQQEKERKDMEMERLKNIPANEMSLAELRYYRARSNERKGLMAVDFNKIMNDPQSEDNITVMHRDSIIVPKKINYVNIQGRVINPGNIKYVEGANYLDYIALAGGYGFRADENETFIRKSKGEIFLASDMNYVIEPGDVILVPPEEEISFMEVFTRSVTILAQLATIAGVIVALISINKQ